MTWDACPYCGVKGTFYYGGKFSNDGSKQSVVCVGCASSKPTGTAGSKHKPGTDRNFFQKTDDGLPSPPGDRVGTRGARKRGFCSETSCSAAAAPDLDVDCVSKGARCARCCSKKTRNCK